MVEWDGIRPGQIVQTVGLSWRQGDLLKSKVYRVDRWDERNLLLRVLDGIADLQILGQNIPFDVMALRAFDPRFKTILRPERCRLIELQVVNFLQNDQRVERSLKNLSLVLSVADYRDEEVDLRKGERYTSTDDQRLWLYNAKDCLATLLDYEHLVEAIRLWYGDTTDKWTPYSQQWYNDVVWLGIAMSERGVKYDMAQLGETHRRYKRALAFLEERAKERWNWPLQGTGSGTAKKEHIIPMIEEYAPTDLNARQHYHAQVKRSKITKEISCDRENIWLLRGVVPLGTADRGKLVCFSRYQKLRKIVESYTAPLLREVPEKKLKSEKGLREANANALVRGYAYPSWHSVPSYVSDDDKSGKQGGTSQCRITPRAPALQTHPPTIERCQRSRHKGGALVRIDESQSEVRVATGWFGDEIFMELYQQQDQWRRMYEDLRGRGTNHDEAVRVVEAELGPKANVHASTASEIAGYAVGKSTHPKEYHAGKTLNFLVLFLGQWRAFQQTCLREVGWEIPDRQAREMIERWDRRHANFRQGQQALIEEACRRGYVEIPLVGASRTYLGSAKETYASTIVNQPVQAISALLTLSAQIEMEKFLRQHNLKTLTVSNTYDEGVYDCPPGEVSMVAEEGQKLFRNPPLYRKLVEEGYLLDVPLDAEVDIAWNS
jgi:hypothetical protein